jgi:SAM-dependent methyltransferase
MVRDWIDTAREIFDIVFPTITRPRKERRFPPVWLRDVGPSDFEGTGNEFLRYFIELACLQPSDAVLDIGCGPGRMTLPLTGYLHAGDYVGVDVTARSIRWCRRHISRRFPHFDFHHADIFNGRYNPRGKIQASDYIFPFGTDSFDFVFLTSVFTHMFPDDVRHYLHEIARLMRPKGRMLATFFLLNPTQLELAQQKRNDIDFRYCKGIYRARDETIPESALAIEEGEVRRMFSEAALEIVEPIHFGRWTGRRDALSYQDIVLAVPKAA